MIKFVWIFASAIVLLLFNFVVFRIAVPALFNSHSTPMILLAVIVSIGMLIADAYVVNELYSAAKDASADLDEPD